MSMPVFSLASSFHPRRLGPTMFLFLALAILLAAPCAASSDLPVHDNIGGEFTLQNSRGHEGHLSDYRDQVVLLFFGFTSCPDICPANLAHLLALTRSLGDDAAGTQVVLVTVDPETDTPERLKEYLGRFDERFVGFTGTREETDHVAELFLVKHSRTHNHEITMKHNREKAFEESGFLYAHSQQIYLLDKQGRTRALYYTGTPTVEMAAGVRALLKE